jgi:hypothetical protein
MEKNEYYELVRINDGLTNKSTDVTWIEFNENGQGNKRHDEPEIGYSLVMSPFNMFFTWQTTVVTEIITNEDGFVHFKTQNSEYKLYKKIKEDEQA